MKCRNVTGTIMRVISDPVADTLFAVKHEMGKVPRGAFVARTIHSTAMLYHPSIGTTLDLTPNLIAAWEFENSGALGTDSGPNTLTLTNSANPVTQVAGGKPGFAGNFVRVSSQKLTRVDDAFLSMGNIDFTIAAWVTLASKPSFSDIVAKTGADPNREYWLAYVASTDRFTFFVTSNGLGATQVEVRANTFGSPSLNTWYFIVAWHDSVLNTINISVNDGTTDSLAHTLGVANALSPFMLGSSNFGAVTDHDGKIDQAMIWKRVLTPAEREALYNSGAGMSYAQVATPVVSVLYPWDATNAYMKCNVANAPFYVLFF